MTTAKRLTRSRQDKLIGGVCGGLGEYFNLDPTLIRLAFALLIVFGVGSPLLLYILLWIIMPTGPATPKLIDVADEMPVEPGIKESGIKKSGIKESGIKESGIKESGIEEVVTISPDESSETEATPA